MTLITDIKFLGNGIPIDYNVYLINREINFHYLFNFQPKSLNNQYTQIQKLLEVF